MLHASDPGVFWMACHWPYGMCSFRMLATVKNAIQLRSGFPRALLDLKDALAGTCKGLPPENPGSKWPKTTLGALRDGTRLTPEQLQQLNAICK